MDSHPSIAVGVAQIDCQLGDLAHNLQTHLRMVAQAHDAGVELLLFPELSLTGCSLGARVPDVALRRDSETVAVLARAAGAMTIVFGLVEEGPAAQFYNASAAVRNGQLLHLHRKINLPTYGNLEEGKLFAAGHRIENFSVARDWNASLLICADLWNPALVHLSMLQQATIVLAPINSALGAVSDDFSNPDGWDLASRFYAMMYGVPILLANRVGSEGVARFWGGSRIIGPRGQILAQCGDEGEALLTARLPYTDVRAARFELPTVRDANLPLLQREYARLQTGACMPVKDAACRPPPFIGD